VPTQLLAGLILALLVLDDSKGAPAITPAGSPRAAEGWSVERAVEFGPGLKPTATALAVSPEGAVYVGMQSRMKPAGSVVAVKGPSVQVFADDLGPVSGLEWADGTLLVLEGGHLVALRDGAGKGRADQREDLVRGLDAPAGSGDEPVASGLRLGLDGRVYFAVDDRGLLRASGKGGSKVRLQGGGVVRVRPDGTGLEVVSTGEHRPRSVAIDPFGDVFSWGEPDASGRWPGGLTHHIDGGHYGYPYQFLTAPFRALPVLGGGARRGPGHLVAADQDGLPAAWRDGLFACESNAHQVVRFELRKAGGTFALAGREVVLEPGSLTDFHPVALGPKAEGDGFWVADQASPPTRSGRLYRLTYTAPDRPRSAARPRGGGLDSLVNALDHPALSVRIESQGILARSGGSAVGPLIRRLHGAATAPGRMHALWALDANGTKPAEEAIREVLRDGSARMRLQAARSCGRRGDRAAAGALAGLLGDRDPAVRREAAIALGRLGDRAAQASLLDRLGDPDRLAGWSVRTAIRSLGDPDEEAVRAALVDARRREGALLLADESWSVTLVRALAEALAVTSEARVRGRIVAALAGQYRRFPEWTGAWWGPTPLAGEFPRKTRDWDPVGQAAVLTGLRAGMEDGDESVRFQAIVALGQVGAGVAAPLRAAFATESVPRNQEALVEALGLQHDPASMRLLTGLMADVTRPEPLRAAALDALAEARGPEVLRARLSLAYDPATPPSLVASALPPLARTGILPPNDLAGFLESPSPEVRAAALLSLNVKKGLPPDVRRLVLAGLDDSSEEVRQAAVLAVGALKLTEAIPQLVAIAAKPGDELRPQAVAALCRMPDPRAGAIYQGASREEDPALRLAALRALQALPRGADPEVMPAAMPPRGPAPDIKALRRFVLGHPGDPRKGEELFREHRGVSCSGCHLPGRPRASSPGPDLGVWAATRTRVELAEALLSPRAAVATAHRSIGGIERVFSPLDLADLVSYLMDRTSASDRRPAPAG
jgi:HEAT repeat protein